jgi:hypothetical protein
MKSSYLILFSTVLVATAVGNLAGGWWLRVWVMNFPLDEGGNLRVSVDGEPPHETLFLTAILNQSNITVVGTTLLVSNSSIATLNNRSVTFLGGGVSGGASWKMGVGYETTVNHSVGGGVPGAGRVVVYDNSGNLLGQFALPLNVKLKFQNVGRIELYVEVPILAMEWTLMNYGMYSAFIVASVYYWVE